MQGGKMSTQTIKTVVERNAKQDTSNFEKELMVFNLRTAVEMFGRNYMRKHFKDIKAKNLHN